MTLAAETSPAGGAATSELIAMTIALTVLFGALLLIGESYRRARRGPLAFFAPFSERVSGLPAWSAIPLAVTGVSLVGALFGYMWDVSIHIADGRDEGPLANPSHYFILAGLYGIIAAGYLSTVLPKRGEVPGRSALRISDEWSAHTCLFFRMPSKGRDASRPAWTWTRLHLTRLHLAAGWLRLPCVGLALFEPRPEQAHLFEE